MLELMTICSISASDVCFYHNRSFNTRKCGVNYKFIDCAIDPNIVSVIRPSVKIQCWFLFLNASFLLPRQEELTKIWWKRFSWFSILLLSSRCDVKLFDKTVCLNLLRLRKKLRPQAKGCFFFGVKPFKKKERKSDILTCLMALFCSIWLAILCSRMIFGTWLFFVIVLALYIEAKFPTIFGKNRCHFSVMMHPNFILISPRDAQLFLETNLKPGVGRWIRLVLWNWFNTVRTTERKHKSGSYK